MPTHRHPATARHPPTHRPPATGRGQPMGLRRKRLETSRVMHRTRPDMLAEANRKLKRATGIAGTFRPTCYGKYTCTFC